VLDAAVLAQQRWRRQLGAAAMASVGQTLVAEHAWQSGNAGDLQFAAGVLIEVTSLAPGSGWITGRLADGTTGIFPSNFVRTNGPVDSATRARSATAPESSAASDGGSAGRQRSGSAHPAGGSPSAPMHYVAAHAFDPQGQAGCIALAAGEAVVVTDNSREDWWQGFRTAEPGKLGSFPKAYVQPAPAAAAVAAPASDSGAQAALRAEELERKAKLEEWAAKQAAEAEAEEQKAVADAAKRAEQAEQAERVEAAKAEENARVAAEQEAAAKAKAEADAAEARAQAEADAAAAAVAAATALEAELVLLSDVTEHARELLAGGSQPNARAAILAAVTAKLGGAVIEEAVPPTSAPEPAPEPAPADGFGPPPPSPSPVASAAAVGAVGASSAAAADGAGVYEEAEMMAEAAKAAERATILNESRHGTAPPRPRMPMALNRDIARFSVHANHKNHFRAKKTKGFMGIFGRRHLTSEELASHTDRPIDQPLLVETPKGVSQEAVDHFRHVMTWMDELPTAGGAGGGGGSGGGKAAGEVPAAPAWGVEQFAAAGFVLRLAAGAGAQTPQLIDEMYCQICKQTATNPSTARRTRGLGLLLLLANVAMPADPEIRASTIRMTDRLLSGGNFERTSSSLSTTNSSDTEKVPGTHTLRLCRALMKVLNNDDDSTASVRIFPAGIDIFALSDAAVANGCEIVSGYVMGVRIGSLIDRRRKLAAQPDATLPEVIEQLVSLVRKKGGHSLEGIFRVSGTKESADELMAVIDASGDHPDTAQVMAAAGPFVAATALKQWLGALVEPVFPFPM
jgi:hypothetical protein